MVQINLDSDEDSDSYTPTEQEVDQVIQQGLAAAAKGENVEHLLEVMLALFPVGARSLITKKFSRALEQRKLQQPAKEPDRAPRSKLVRLYQMFARIIQQQATARVTSLIRGNARVAHNVNQQGTRLAANGVATDKERLTGADLGTLAPSAGIGAGKGRSSGRDV